MDPYLEQHWSDVHTSLVTYARDQLRAQMPSDLKIRVEEHVTIRSPDEGPARRYIPDVTVSEKPFGGGAATAVLEEVATAEPILVPLMMEPETERSIQIIDTRSGNRLVTAIEFLSPGNKSREAGRAAYRQMQRDLWSAGVNLVEIDLLREGDYSLIVPSELVPRRALGPYRIAVLRASNPNFAEMYPVPLRRRLPIIRIPLRQSDPDATLDLQKLIDAAYENGGYEDVDYRQPPIPPLSSEEAAWAEILLRERDRR